MRGFQNISPIYIRLRLRHSGLSNISQGAPKMLETRELEKMRSNKENFPLSTLKIEATTGSKKSEYGNDPILKEEWLFANFLKKAPL